MKRSSKLLLAFSIIIVLIAGLLGSMIQSDFYSVDVRDVRIPAKDGQVLSGLLFVPENVSNENPAPAVLTMHGYINSRETQSGFNIEFARRGYVVLSLDMAGHGYSEQIAGDLSSGGSDALRFLHDLDFVDSDNVAVEGHSMGGWSLVRAVNDNPDLVKTVILEGSSPETYGSGEVTATSPFNFAVVFSKYDEFSQLMWGVEVPSDIVKTEKLKKAFGVTEDVVPEELYGSFVNNSARKLYIPSNTHPGDHLSTEAIGNAIEFLQDSIAAPNEIDPENQIWPWKEFATLLGLIGFIIFIFAVSSLILQTKFFGSLIQPLPDFGGAQKWGWWISAIIATAIPAVFFFTFQEWGQANIAVTAFWPQQLTNGFVAWVTFVGLIALGLFIVWHFISGRKQNGNTINYGLSTSTENKKFSWNYIGKSLLFSVIVMFFAHLLVAMTQWAFLIDFRWWVLAVKPLDFTHFRIVLDYIPPFLFFFLINGLILHVQLRYKEKGNNFGSLLKSMLTNGIVNALGIVVIVILQLGSLYMTETLFFPSQSLLGIVAYQFVFITFVTGLFSTYFFRKTGNIYTGAFINAFFVTWYIVAGQATHFVL